MCGALQARAAEASAPTRRHSQRKGQLRGTKTARNKSLSFLHFHITTRGFTMAWPKAARGPDPRWIRVPVQLRVAERAALMTIDEKTAKESSTESRELPKKSTVPSKWLRNPSGRVP